MSESLPPTPAPEKPVLRITTIRVATAKTINLGNFQSLRIEADVTAEIGQGDDIAAMKPLLQAELKALLDETYRAQRKQQTEDKPRNDNPQPGEFKPARVDPEY